MFELFYVEEHSHLPESSERAVKVSKKTGKNERMHENKVSILGKIPKNSDHHGFAILHDEGLV